MTRESREHIVPIFLESQHAGDERGILTLVYSRIDVPVVSENQFRVLVSARRNGRQRDSQQVPINSSLCSYFPRNASAMILRSVLRKGTGERSFRSSLRMHIPRSQPHCLDRFIQTNSMFSIRRQRQLCSYVISNTTWSQLRKILQQQEKEEETNRLQL